MGKEFELKYAVPDRQARERVLRYLGDGVAVTKMSTTYYDTPSAALSQRKWTLRLRRENEDSVVTFKTAGDGRTRGEWEYRADSIDAEALAALGAPRELPELLREGIRPVCGAEFIRRAGCVMAMRSAVEVALDEGKLFRGDRELPICELEVELKDGREEDALAFAGWLAEFAGLREETKSKFVRAIEL